MTSSRRSFENDVCVLIEREKCRKNILMTECKWVSQSLKKTWAKRKKQTITVEKLET